MDITGAVALIAGGGGGFGAATARRLHAAGARVVVSDLDEAKGKAVADELGDGALFVQTDVTDADSVQRAIDAAAELGPLRIAVVAHGGGGGPRTLDKESPAPLESFTKVVDIFLAATYNIDRLAAAAIARPSRSRTASAVSSSTPPPSPPTTARSARPPTRRPRAASSR